MFELSQLRCFVAVAEELHFGHAAESLNMTQPPLSRQIQLLEQALEVKLLERTSRSVQMTPAGRAFLPEARRVLRLAEGAVTAAKRVARGDAGSIAISFTGGSSYSFLPRLMALATAEMPDVDIVLREMVTTAQIEALGANRIDLGLVRLPIDRRGLGVMCVHREPLLVAVPQNHPLANGNNPTVRNVHQRDFIMYSPTEGRYFHDLVISVLRSSDVLPKYVQYIHHIHTILGLVGVGMGIALVPESAQTLHFEGVVLRPLRLSPKTYAELHLVWRRNNDNPALNRFRELVTNRLLEATP
jgi:DNA-binding transcriptional LysR family regulator